MREASRFYMKEGPVYETLQRMTVRLAELNIPYAVVGGMALNAHGYVPPFAGSKDLRDVTTQVKIKFLVTGQYPGKGKPRPVPFHDPAGVGVGIDGVHPGHCIFRPERLLKFSKSIIVGPGRLA